MGIARTETIRGGALSAFWALLIALEGDAYVFSQKKALSFMFPLCIDHPSHSIARFPPIGEGGVGQLP